MNAGVRDAFNGLEIARRAAQQHPTTARHLRIRRRYVTTMIRGSVRIKASCPCACSVAWNTISRSAVVRYPWDGCSRRTRPETSTSGLPRRWQPPDATAGARAGRQAAPLRRLHQGGFMLGIGVDPRAPACPPATEPGRPPGRRGWRPCTRGVNAPGAPSIGLATAGTCWSWRM